MQTQLLGRRSVLNVPQSWKHQRIKGLRASTTVCPFTKAGRLSPCLRCSSHNHTLCPLAKCTSILFLTGGNGSMVKLVTRSHKTAEHRHGILNQFALALKPKVFPPVRWPAKAGSKRCKHARSSRVDLAASVMQADANGSRQDI